MWCQACNRDVVEKAFSGCILHSKLLTPHQCSQLVMFMVDHVKTLFDIPSDVAHNVRAHLHSPLSSGEKSAATSPCHLFHCDIFKNKRTTLV